MNDQYCKVGAITPITSGQQALSVLEHRYQKFREKATDPGDADTSLKEFFEQKAEKIQKILEGMQN